MFSIFFIFIYWGMARDMRLLDKILDVGMREIVIFGKRDKGLFQYEN